MEKSGKDVALIAPCVLEILDLVLRSGDLTMVESSITTFDAFASLLTLHLYSLIRLT